MRSVAAWLDSTDNIYYDSSQRSGVKVIASENSNYMFASINGMGSAIDWM